MFAYDYHPTSRTLFTEHFTPKPPTVGKNGRLQPQEMHVQERTLWSYITQLANALKAIHSEGLAARMVEPSKILCTGRNRCGLQLLSPVGGDLDSNVFRSNQNTHQLLCNPRCRCGRRFSEHGHPPGASALLDTRETFSCTLTNTSHFLASVLQQEDLLSLGKLILALTNLSVSAVQNLPKALEILSRSYSNEVKNLVMFLLSKPGPMGKTIDEVLSMLGPRLLNELDASQK